MDDKRSFCNLGFANIDIDRKVRLKKIARELIRNEQDLLFTRLEKDNFNYLKKSFSRLKYNALAKIGYFLKNSKVQKKGLVAVISAGTSDIPVAEEAVVTLE